MMKNVREKSERHRKEIYSFVFVRIASIDINLS